MHLYLYKNFLKQDTFNSSVSLYSSMFHLVISGSIIIILLVSYFQFSIFFFGNLFFYAMVLASFFSIPYAIGYISSINIFCLIITVICYISFIKNV